MTVEEQHDTLHTLFFGNGARKVADLGLVTLSASLLAALAASLLLSWAYSTFYGARATGSNVHRAFPLIGVAVAAIFICVQFSLPLSLGLLGSLSVVRFRTPIKEPEEIGFIMLVIASALCCASFNVAFLLVLFGAVFVGLALLRWYPSFLSPRAGSGTLVIRCAAAQSAAMLPEIKRLVEAHLQKPLLESLSSQQDECVMSWTFAKATAEQSIALKNALLLKLPEAAVGLYHASHANA